MNAKLQRSGLLFSNHSGSRSRRRNCFIQQLARMKGESQHTFTGTTTPCCSSLPSPQSSPSPIPSPNTPETVPGCIYLFTHFTISYGHDTGTRLWLRVCPCEGCCGNPETRARGQGRRQRSTVEWEVRGCVEAYRGEMVSKAMRGIPT
jgi:hypothetical protein